MEKLTLIIVVLLLATPVLAAEAIVNGGFETGSLNPWTFDYDWSVVTTNPHGGSYCAFGVDLHYIHQAFTPIPVDDVNSITLWVRQPESFQFRARLYYGEDNWDQPDDFVIPNENWNQINLTNYLRTTGEIEGIRFYSYNGGGPDPNYTYVDDVSVIYSGGSAVESSSLGELKAVFH